jgi:hypothetical protein
MGIRVERKGDIFKEFDDIVDMMSNDMISDLMKLTPRITGKARVGWLKRSVRSRARLAISISNRVAHAFVLDEGRKKAPHRKGMQGSKKAPKGMTKPAIKELQRRVSRGKYKMKRRK